MKKVILLAAVVAVALASCQSKAKKAAEAEADSLAIAAAATPQVEGITDVFAGTIPTPNGPAIDYVLTLNAETNGTDTVYTLDMNYLDPAGKQQTKKETTTGMQKAISKVVNNTPKKAYKLIPSNGQKPLYFVVVNDTTLRLVKDSLLQETISQSNYDIIKVQK